MFSPMTFRKQKRSRAKLNTQQQTKEGGPQRPHLETPQSIASMAPMIQESAGTGK